MSFSDWTGGCARKLAYDRLPSDFPSGEFSVSEKPRASSPVRQFQIVNRQSSIVNKPPVPDALANSKPVVLQVKDLTVNYGVITALHGISMEIRRGDIVTLIGAN